MYGALFLLPFFLRNILGYTAIKAGIAMLPLTASMVLLAPLGGKLGDRMGSRLPATIGMAIITLALFSFSRMTEQTDGLSITWRLILMGTGLAFTMSPLSNGVMGSLPPNKIGVGSGIFNLFKNVGGSVGVAIMGALLDERQSLHKDILKDYVSFSYPSIDNAYVLLYGFFKEHGLNDVAAAGLAVKKMHGLTVFKAAVLSYQDVFLASAWIAAFGVLAAVFIKGGKDANKQVQAIPPAQDFFQPAAEGGK
jgi:nitrate/nitrite transporter NarK